MPDSVSCEEEPAPGKGADSDAPRPQEVGHAMQNNRTTWIYFIETEDGRFVKIGKSHNVIKRFYAIQGANPGLKLLGVIPESPEVTEYTVQASFAADHHEGEWFHSSPRIGEFIKRLQHVSMPPRRVVLGIRRPQPETSRVPILQSVPQVLPVSKKGPPIGLMEARYADLRAYCWMLANKDRERLRNNPKLKQAEALRDKMKEHAHREPGITVRQVLLLEEL